MDVVVFIVPDVDVVPAAAGTPKDSVGATVFVVVVVEVVVIPKDNGGAAAVVAVVAVPKLKVGAPGVARVVLDTGNVRPTVAVVLGVLNPNVGALDVPKLLNVGAVVLEAGTPKVGKVVFVTGAPNNGAGVLVEGRLNVEAAGVPKVGAAVFAAAVPKVKPVVPAVVVVGLIPKLVPKAGACC